jgi:hypothetical protein
MAKSVERKLAANFSADVVNSAWLMGSDEKAIRAHPQTHRWIVAPVRSGGTSGRRLVSNNTEIADVPVRRAEKIA